MASTPDSIPDFSKSSDGLIPAIAQDAKTGEVLMLAYVNEEAWKLTLECAHAVYWSRSRQQLWRKGESSGNVQKIVDILIDCDGDTLIFKVDQVGDVACHTGRRSCFFYRWQQDNNSTKIISEPLMDPKEMYKKK